MGLPQAEGHAFGKYQLLDRIAAGGMAEIYRARYTGAAGVTKSVVVKKILPHYAGNKNFVSMFINEAKIVVGLSHGNIAQVFDFGEIDGEYFLAMEFVDGQPLSRVLRRMRDMQIPVMPTPFAVYVAMEVCKGLQYAHTRLDEQGRPLNIVHRDVSPQNVIISYEGQIKIVDFGIAKAKNAGRSETEAGAVKGKYVYFSPEQAKGKDLDARSDVFAAGIGLYEMVCGRLPFEGKMMEVLGKIVRCDFPRPRLINPDVTPGLERILLTAMAAECEDRYPTAQAFQEALAAYLYANAPTFSSSQIAHLMGYLYESELVSEGRPVQLPRDFLDQAPLWRKKLQTMDERNDDTRPLLLDKPKLRAASPTDEALILSPEPESQALEYPSLVSRVPSRWLFLAAPLLAMLIAALVVLAVGHFGSYSVHLTSSPPGALVEVDGQPAPGPTPLLISNLAADRPHHLTITAPGMRPWAKDLPPKHGGTLFVDAKLTPDATLAPPPHPVVEAPPPAPAPAPPEASRREVQYPAGKPIELSARDSAAIISNSRAARMAMDKNRVYRVWTEGKLSVGGSATPRSLDQVFFYADGTPELPASESFGVLTPKGRTFRHVKMLYAFVVDEDPTHNSGAIRVRSQEKGERNPQELVVGGRENAVSPDPVEVVKVRGLDPTRRYALTLKEGATPARLKPGKLGHVDRIFYVQSQGWPVGTHKSADDAFRVLEVGSRAEISGAEHFQVFFADDDKADNDGQLTLEVSELPKN